MSNCIEFELKVVLLNFIKYPPKKKGLFENYLYVLTAFVTVSGPGGVGASVGVNAYSHDCGANSSEPIHMQHFHRHVYDSSSENSLSPACVILRCRCKSVPSQHRGE